MDKEIEYEEDLDDIDFNNYKGIFYDESAEKYQDEETGAHFEYKDMCMRLNRLKRQIEIKELINKPPMSVNQSQPPLKAINDPQPPIKQDNPKESEVVNPSGKFKN